ncbi:MAG: ptpA 4 [Gemmatimonadetes bacterium]|nr:ptpA 4 [Gemmatimonadota bacterium]
MRFSPRRALVLVAVSTILPAFVAVAQVPAAVDQAVRAIFTGRGGSGRGARFGPARWSAKGDAYSTLESAANGGADIVEYDAASGARRVLVTAGQLKPAGAAQPLDVENYEWTRDGKRLLIFTNTRKVWRQNTRGDYWVLDVASGKLHRVGAGAAEATLMFAKFSPDGRRVAYVRSGDLYTEPATGGPAVRLTKTGSKTIVNGMTDWVYEEEFDLRDAFRWSPDGRLILFWQFDMSAVRDFLLINDTDSLYPFVTPVQYPKAGTKNSSVRLGIVSAMDGGKVTWLPLHGDGKEQYVPRAEWATEHEVLVQHMDRKQQHDWFELINENGRVYRTLFTESDSAWVDYADELKWVKGDSSFLSLSERDGWRHVYLTSRFGGPQTLVTPGAYDVMSLEAVDDANGWIYVMASPESATQRYLYRVPLREPGPPQRVSPADAPGTHSYDISPTARFAFHTYSRAGRPATVDLVSLPSHAVIRALGTPPVAPTVAIRQEFFQVKVPDGATLDGWMIKPHEFDQAKKYPVLVFVYGEPASQTVVDRFGGPQDTWHQLLADQGYVIMSVDVRGTPAPKGRDWRKVIYGNIGTISSQEEADAVRAMTRTHAYLDSTRVGIWGWSGGASSTLSAMFRHGDVFSVGMSVAPVPDQHLYDTIYQERYMGLPQENAKGYESGSPITWAAGLTGKLLVVHGSGDDNVHYQGTERLINTLVSLGKPFDVMVYPNRTHCICEGEGTTAHIYSLLTRYLLTNLPAGGR